MSLETTLLNKVLDTMKFYLRRFYRRIYLLWIYFFSSIGDWLAINSNEPKQLLSTKHANFGQKRGSEVETNSVVSFVSDMLDIKGKCDPQMCNSDA